MLSLSGQLRFWTSVSVPQAGLMGFWRNCFVALGTASQGKAVNQVISNVDSAGPIPSLFLSSLGMSVRAYAGAYVATIYTNVSNYLFVCFQWDTCVSYTCYGEINPWRDRHIWMDIYIYIYEWCGVIIWSKFGLLRGYYLVRVVLTLFVKNTIRIGVSAQCVWRKSCAQQIQGLLSGPSLCFKTHTTWTR